MKTCPFCGGIAKLKAPGYEHYSPCWVKCTQCGAEGPAKSSEEEAEKGWNERAQEGLELLKEQEPEKVLSMEHDPLDPGYYDLIGNCPGCNAHIEQLTNRHYCGYCGKAVIWE